MRGLLIEAFQLPGFTDGEKEMKPCLFIIVFAAGSIAGCDKIPGTEAHTIEGMKHVVSGNFFDPDAVQFRNASLRSVWVVTAPRPVPALCGEANGKNRHGAYVGFQRFIYADVSDGFYMDPQIDVDAKAMSDAKARCPSVDKTDGYDVTALQEAASNCRLYADMYRELGPQFEFDTLWQNVCVAPTPLRRPQSQIDAAKKLGIALPNDGS